MRIRNRKMNLNKLLNREEDALKIKELLKTFDLNKHNILLKKGIYIYGEPGTGKTEFITTILNELDYEENQILEHEF